MSVVELLPPPMPSTESSIVRPALSLRFLSASSRKEAFVLWRTLEANLASRRLACSSIWLETWLNHYGALIPHQFAVGTRGGVPCGIALLTQGVRQTAGPFNLKTWHVGTAGEPESESVCVEYNSLLVGFEDHDEFSLALCQWVQEETNCDEFRLDGFDTPSIEPFLQRNPHTSVERRPSYYFDLRSLRECGEEPIVRLGAHTRGNIRRTLRDLGETRGEWADSTSRAESLFHQMVRLHQARWNKAGLPGVYSSRRFFEFHLDLLVRTVPSKMTAIFGVKASNRLIGCCQIFFDDRRALLYQCGRAPAVGRASIGLAMDYMCICEGLRQGYDAVDFLAGDGDHKRRLSTNRAELAWVVWRRQNMKNAAIDTMRRIKRATVKFGRSMSIVKPAKCPMTSEPTPSVESEQKLS